MIVKTVWLFDEKNKKKLDAQIAHLNKPLLKDDDCTFHYGVY